MEISFEKVTPKYQQVIFNWLAKPHMQEFWDNSQEHKDDIINFINGRKEPSNYFNGLISYWVGISDEQPFCFILTSEIKTEQQDITDLHRANLSKTGHTITLDFGIGNTHFLGKGFAAPTLKAFTEFFSTEIDSQADTFFIDPNEDNPRAQHVYEKAGFKRVGEFNADKGTFKGHISYLMVKKINRV